MRIERFRWIAILPFVLLGFTGCDDDNCTNVVYRVPPPVPTGVYTVTGDGLVQVYWSPIRGIDVRRFGVWRSLVPEGPYEWVADVSPSEDPYYIDSGLQNGVTYYYAVDAQNDYGESDLSYELVADTPRPDGEDLVLYYEGAEPDLSGLDLSRIQERGVAQDMIVGWDDPLADCYLIQLDGLFRLIPTEVEEGGEVFVNDVQDFGYTDHMDEINFAPVLGWSRDAYGVELIEGHVYIIWTWDDHFAKVRVSALGQDYVVFDWAYQISDDDIERRQLSPGFLASGSGS